MTPRTSAVDVAARAAIVRLVQRMASGTIALREGDTLVTLGRGQPVVDVNVLDQRAYRALLRGSSGLAESYMAGWWECDDLTELVQLLMRNLAGVGRALDRVGTAARPLLDPLARLRRRHRSDDRRYIRAHYDIGNDLYALMLDPTMTYSCAVFEHPETSLADAQRAKLDRICRTLDLSPTDHVVEIGTGWGSFAIHAASRYGCRVTTTTISDAQHDLATKRVVDAGLAHRVTVLDADYRDLEGTFDKLVSIEMIEAVDWRDHDTFFSTCAALLRDGGLAALQAIVIADESFERAKRHDDFIRRHIFPGGCLPSITSLSASARRAGFHLTELHDIGKHYPTTLQAWRGNVREHGAEVAAMGFGDDFRRMWDLYLAYCEAAFLERHISDVQVLLAAPVTPASLTGSRA